MGAGWICAFASQRSKLCNMAALDRRVMGMHFATLHDHAYRSRFFRALLPV